MPRSTLAPHIQLLLLLASASLSLMGCGVLDSWACGYGGPGCGEPGLMGLCEPMLPLGQDLEVTTVYFDDTGSHPAKLLSSSVDDAELMELLEGQDTGTLILSPLAPGEVTLSLEIEGWQQARTWTLTIDDDLEIPVDDPATPEDESCRISQISPNPQEP